MITVVSIYYKGGLIERIAEDFASQGAELHFWALDDIVPAVRQWTRGVGPGDKVTNLNRLFPYFRSAEHVLFADDDVEFPPNFLKKLLELVERFGLELAQPALSYQSEHTFPQTLARPGLLVRETNWVEQMVFYMSHALVQRVMPTPEDFWMGWGMELSWAKAIRDNGWKAGIIDHLPVHHRTRPISSGYNSKRAGDSSRAAFAKLGLSYVPMRTLRAFSESGAADWIDARATRFVTTWRKVASATPALPKGEMHPADTRRIEAVSPKLKLYGMFAGLVYRRMRSAFIDDLEIKALFEGEAKLEDRERFLVDLASIGAERHEEDAPLLAQFARMTGTNLLSGLR